MQNITIKLKKLGKKKIKQFDIELESSIKNLENLIIQMVRFEVKQFNKKQETPNIISFLSSKELEIKSQDGKVSFGDTYNKEKAVESVAIENALLAFTDGLFVVFVDNDEIKSLDENIDLTQKSEVVFMRLTFLTGTYW